MKSPDEIAALLAKPNHAVVGVNRPGAAPQLSVVWYIWDGESFFFSTKTERVKYVNLRRDPAISLLVNDLENAWYVAAFGTAEITTDGHPDLARRLFAKYLPGTDPGETAHDPKRVVVAVRPHRLITGS